MFNKFFFRLSTREHIARQSCAIVRRWRFFASYLRPVFPASRVQHIYGRHMEQGIPSYFHPVVCSSYGRPAQQMRALYFCPAVSFYLSIFFSSPNLSRRRLDVCRTLTHGVALVRIQNAGLKCGARVSLQMQDPKKLPKIAIWASSHNFVRLYLRNYGTYRQSEKKLVKQQYLLYMSPQYGELRPTSG